MQTRTIEQEPGALAPEKQPPGRKDTPSPEKERKPDDPVGEAFPDRDPKKKKTGEF